MNYFEAILQINELINDICELKDQQDIQDPHNKHLLVDPIFTKAENLIRDLYKDLPDDRQHMIDDLGILVNDIAERDNRYQLDALLNLLMVMEDQIREKEMLDKMERSAPDTRFPSLAAALRLEKEKKEKFARISHLYEADAQKLTDQVVKLRNALNIGSLILLFLVTVILQLLLHKTNWPATGILAGILLVMALIFAFEGRIKKLLPTYWLRHQFITAIFVITGMFVAGYFIYLLRWS